MVETTYTYSITTDTAVGGGGDANLSLLEQQIQDSGISGGAKADYTHTSQSGDVLECVFANAISEGGGSDKEALDGVLAVHDGTLSTTATQRAQDFSTVHTNATATWQTALALNCAPLVAGNWSVDVRCELRLQVQADFSSGAPDRAGDARLLIDGANRVNWLTPWQDFDNKQASDVLAFTEGAAPVFLLQFRRRGASTAEVTRCIINLTFIGT